MAYIDPSELTRDQLLSLLDGVYDINLTHRGKSFILEYIENHPSSRFEKLLTSGSVLDLIEKNRKDSVRAKRKSKEKKPVFRRLAGKQKQDPQYDIEVEFSTDGTVFSNPIDVKSNTTYQVRMRLRQHQTEWNAIGFALDWKKTSNLSWADGKGTRTYAETVSNPLVIARKVRTGTIAADSTAAVKVVVAARYSSSGAGVAGLASLGEAPSTDIPGGSSGGGTPTTPPPTPPPVITGWTTVFHDDFSTWNTANYFAYPYPWNDTSGQGTYSPDIISSDGSKLRLHIQTVGGVHKVATFMPIGVPGGSGAQSNNFLALRVEFRLRADYMPTYKGVPLLWPQSENWPTDGEIDGPEGDFDVIPMAAFMHRQGGTSGGDQTFFGYPAGTSWQDWHTYATEWVAGVSCEYFLDGVSIGSTTTAVPSTPMGLRMQFETNLNGDPVDSGVNGYVEIDYLTLSVPT